MWMAVVDTLQEDGVAAMTVLLQNARVQPSATRV